MLFNMCPLLFAAQPVWRLPQGRPRLLPAAAPAVLLPAVHVQLPPLAVHPGAEAGGHSTAVWAAVEGAEWETVGCCVGRLYEGCWVREQQGQQQGEQQGEQQGDLGGPTTLPTTCFPCTPLPALHPSINPNQALPLFHPLCPPSSQPLQVFGHSPDETAFARIQLNREPTGDSMLMIQPTLYSFSFNGADVSESTLLLWGAAAGLLSTGCSSPRSTPSRSTVRPSPGWCGSGFGGCRWAAGDWTPCTSPRPCCLVLLQVSPISGCQNRTLRSKVAFLSPRRRARAGAAGCVVHRARPHPAAGRLLLRGGFFLGLWLPSSMKCH